MATIERKRDLAIAIDPGFDSTKVIINGIFFKVPKEVVDVTNNFELIGKKQHDFIKTYYLSDKEFLVGNQARSLMQQPKMKKDYEKMQSMMDSFERFTTENFEINLITCIGYALIKYSDYCKTHKVFPQLKLIPGDTEEAAINNRDELKKCRIFIGLALPHDAVSKSFGSIKNKLAREHKFGVETYEDFYNIHLTLDGGHICVNSQVLAALLGALSDDEGYEKDGMNILENLPALVIDGGYKTVGISNISTIQTVADAESNTDFAMGNIHKKVAKRIQEEYGRTDINAYNIPGILEDKQYNGKIVYEKDGTTHLLDISKLVEEEREETAKELINYLNNKYTNLLDFRFILVTGGTGKAYYDELCEYINKHRTHLKGKVIITDYDFMGEAVDPVFAIVVGMYKTVLNRIRAFDEANMEK